MKHVNSQLSEAKAQMEVNAFGFNEFSDGEYDTSANAVYIRSIEEFRLWNEIWNNPYFARIDHGHAQSHI